MLSNGCTGYLHSLVDLQAPLWTSSPGQKTFGKSAILSFPIEQSALSGRGEHDEIPSSNKVATA